MRCARRQQLADQNELCEFGGLKVMRTCKIQQHHLPWPSDTMKWLGDRRGL
jgi:hypothetical protein